ncbi:sulfite exporter TauE/SafE family protein [bacterium]|nr:sulfite exporter TauE/SafE family protein [bacterium]
MPNTVTSDHRSGSSMLPWEGLVIGAGAGLFSGLFGIGGGIVIVPALLTMLSMDRRLAHGTSLAATIPVSLASLAVYSTSGNVDWIVAAFLAGGAVCGALVGTHLLQIVPKKPLTIIFIVVILITAARLLVPTEAIGRDELTFLGGMAFIAIGFVTGTLSGLLGIGGGVVMVPALVVLFSMPPVIAKGTSVAVIVPSAIVGTIRNRVNRNVDLRVGTAIGVGGVISAVIGSVIANSLSNSLSNSMFALLLVSVATIQARTLRNSTRLPACATDVVD